MAEYRDPKVTTAKDGKSKAGTWIVIAIVVILLLALLAWLAGWFNTADPEPVPVVTEEPAATTEDPDAVVVTPAEPDAVVVAPAD
ncbi:MAG TPA: hypothetical protein VGN80_02010 [Devosiaceae bacterium]|jgi:hypothetical protein|nr:hypothetical protein [Devosiaceae bacterium]